MLEHGGYEKHQQKNKAKKLDNFRKKKGKSAQRDEKVTTQ